MGGGGDSRELICSHYMSTEIENFELSIIEVNSESYDSDFMKSATGKRQGNWVH
jgi:hypothetical protein